MSIEPGTSVAFGGGVPSAKIIALIYDAPQAKDKKAVYVFEGQRKTFVTDVETFNERG